MCKLSHIHPTELQFATMERYNSALASYLKRACELRLPEYTSCFPNYTECARYIPGYETPIRGLSQAPYH